MPTASSKRTIGQARPGATAGGATEVVGADELRYEADPDWGGCDGGGGASEGGSEAIAILATGRSA